MYDHQFIHVVRRLVFDYVQSPSLKHLRDPRSLDEITQRIIQAVDKRPTLWRKWECEREALLRAAAECWVPTEDLRQFLNSLPGPLLTALDVVQRLRAIHEESYCSYPDERLRDGCLELYARETAEGSELPAIIGALQEYVEQGRERLRVQAEASRRERLLQEKEALEARFLAGADCNWTSIGGSKALYIRKNGRTYRLAPTKDKRWDLARIRDVDDPGTQIGIYGARRDANKVLAKISYEPERRW
jgi:hypothetical protein